MFQSTYDAAIAAITVTEAARHHAVGKARAAAFLQWRSDKLADEALEDRLAAYDARMTLVRKGSN